MIDPRNNPDVRPARLWEWTGFWSFALLALEWAQAQLGLWTDAPSWVPVVLVALPILIRWVRQKVGQPQSFRRI